MTQVIGPVADPVDPWSVASGNQYDVDTIYLRATDGKGHSINVQVPLSTNIHGQVQAIVNHPETKYRSVQDFVRDAVTHRLRYWLEVEQAGRIADLPGVAEHLAAEQTRVMIDQMRMRRQMGVQLAIDMESEFNELLRAGMREDAAAIVDTFDQMMEFWETLPTANQMRDQLTRMRSQLIRAV